MFNEHKQWFGVQFNRYSQTDTDTCIGINIKPIWVSKCISNPYQYICLIPILLFDNDMSDLYQLSVWYWYIYLIQTHLIETNLSVWYNISVWYRYICLKPMPIWVSKLILNWYQYLFDTNTNLYSKFISNRYQYICLIPIYLFDTNTSVWYNYICFIPIYLFYMPVW